MREVICVALHAGLSGDVAQCLSASSDATEANSCCGLDSTLVRREPRNATPDPISRGSIAAGIDELKQLSAKRGAQCPTLQERFIYSI